MGMLWQKLLKLQVKVAKDATFMNNYTASVINYIASVA
jgi:hypothetical protein